MSLQLITEDFQQDSGHNRRDLRLISIGLADVGSGGSHIRSGMTQINQEATSAVRESGIKVLTSGSKIQRAGPLRGLLPTPPALSTRMNITAKHAFLKRGCAAVTSASSRPCHSLLRRPRASSDWRSGSCVTNSHPPLRSQVARLRGASQTLSAPRVTPRASRGLGGARCGPRVSRKGRVTAAGP